jgi:NAD(P)H dehydrogenase (quinone)
LRPLGTDADETRKIAARVSGPTTGCGRTDPSTHAGRTYRLGYEAKTYYELAEAFAEALRQPFSYEPQPPADFLRNVLAAGAEPAYMKCIFDSYTDLTNG